MMRLPEFGDRVYLFTNNLAIIRLANIVRNYMQAQRA